MGPRNSTTSAKRRTKLGLALEASAKEILAHVKGEKRLPTRRVVLPAEVDVKRIRSAARMSQAEFARAHKSSPSFCCLLDLCRKACESCWNRGSPRDFQVHRR